MNNNLTEVVFITDRSGSMDHLTDDTIGGFNSLIEQQKADTNGDVRVTTVLFNHKYEILHDHVDIKEIEPLTREQYHPTGMTALLDAVGRTINSVGERLAATPEEERPGKVMFVITTDGYENSSREFTQSQIKQMIEHQKTKYSWVFMFLGANIDAEEVGQSYGIDRGLSKTYTASSRGVESTYKVTCDTLSYLKSCAASAQSVDTDTLALYLNEVK